MGIEDSQTEETEAHELADTREDNGQTAQIDATNNISPQKAREFGKVLRDVAEELSKTVEPKRRRPRR